jgi:hypothetical protein
MDIVAQFIVIFNNTMGWKISTTVIASNVAEESLNWPFNVI